MMFSRFRFLAALLLALIPQMTWAQMNVNTGGLSVPRMIQNVGNVLIASGWTVCASIFIVGTFLYIISIGKENIQTSGKKMMIGAVIGAIVIAGAKGIMNTVLFFIYG